MNPIKKIVHLIFVPKERCLFLAKRGFYSDEKFLRRYYKLFYKRPLDLENPKRYSEKMQWLKLYNRRPEYSKMVDKYEAKKFVAERIGEEHIIPTYGVWDHFDDIDFDSLPDQFVLKCTHNSGGFAICKDKKTFDKANAKRILEKGLKIDYSLTAGEWPYRNVPRRIIAEKYIPSLGHPESWEYKITCINGKFAFMTVCGGIAHAEYEKRSNDHFDINWNRLPFYVYYKPSTRKIEKPKQFDEMVKISEKLAKDTPYLRVDLYIVDDQIYFGELTFFTWAGFCEFTPDEWDLKLGEMIELPKEKTLAK